MADHHDPSARRYRFGLFTFDPAAGELSREGRKRPLQNQPARVLELLLDRAGELVTHDEFRRAIWPDTTIEFDQGLRYAIARIRSALGDDAETPAYLETVPRRGYRFIAPVEIVGDGEPAASRRGWRIAAAALGATVLATVIGLAVGGPDPTAAPPGADVSPGRATLLVLPFDHLTGDSTDAVLSDGLTEELTTALARIDPARLGVIARTSADRYSDVAAPIDSAARELGIDYALEGSVRSDGGRVRITAQLVRADDRTHVWARTYDRERAGLLEIERDVAGRVAEALALELAPGAVPIPTTAPEAREALFEGRHFLARADTASARRAADALRRAVAIDPDLAPAWAALSDAAFRISERGEALAAARRAVELDDELPEAHWRLANALLWAAWDLDGSRRHYERAVALDPGNAGLYHWYAYWFGVVGDHDRAIATIERALVLDPVSPYVSGDLGLLQVWAGRHDAAVASCRRAVELDPENARAWRCVLEARLQQGRTADAGDAARQVVALTDGGDALPPAGADPETVLDAYWRWELDRREGPPAGAEAAVALVRLGRPEAAFEALERGIEERRGSMLYLAVEPLLDPLRDDARYAGLLRRVGLADAQGRATD